MASQPNDKCRAHFIFLVHGFMGNPDELSYCEDAIKEAAIKPSKEGCGDGEEIITHRVTCNDKKTYDGIEAGGKRVAEEIGSFVRDYRNANYATGGEFHASISFMGYSLGGMYARYAIFTLPLQFDGIVLHPFSFATAATPHLGMASHSYLTLPRFAEYLLGYGFGHTGQDLFRLNRGTNKRGAEPTDLVYRMATDDAFLDPLSAFQRRVSYVNAFAADFQVPTATAGMLSRYSNSWQYLSSDYDHWNPDTTGFDVHVFETRPCERPDGLQSSGTRSRLNDETLTMSLSLDSLGWTKVFVDSRSGMPGPSVRCICRRPRKELMNDALCKKKAEISAEPGGVDDHDVVFESRELRGLIKDSEHWHLAPSGHFVLVAHSKTKSGARKSAKGRPLVDRAASDLVSYVRDWGG